MAHRPHCNQEVASFTNHRHDNIANYVAVPNAVGLVGARGPRWRICPGTPEMVQPRRGGHRRCELSRRPWPRGAHLPPAEPPKL
jgi:hypothetical protein